MFIDHSTHSLDNKGRISIPTRYREELGESFMVCRPFATRKNKCVWIMPKSEWELYTKDIMTKFASNEFNDLRTGYLGSSSPATIDAQGRVIIPLTLRKYADLDDTVILSGNGNRLEVWAQDTWTDVLNNTVDETMMQKLLALGY